jgi:hypothetical protein
MPFESPNILCCARKICFFDIAILVVVAFALIGVVFVLIIITIDPRMGPAPFEFGVQALFAGLEEVS